MRPRIASPSGWLTFNHRTSALHLIIYVTGLDLSLTGFGKGFLSFRRICASYQSWWVGWGAGRRGSCLMSLSCRRFRGRFPHFLGVLAPLRPIWTPQRAEIRFLTVDWSLLHRLLLMKWLLVNLVLEFQIDLLPFGNSGMARDLLPTAPCLDYSLGWILIWSIRPDSSLRRPNLFYC